MPAAGNRVVADCHCWLLLSSVRRGGYDGIAVAAVLLSKSAHCRTAAASPAPRRRCWRRCGCWGEGNRAGRLCAERVAGPRRNWGALTRYNNHDRQP